MVTNFKANSKVNWLPFITLPFPVVFGHSQSFDVSCIYLLCHIFSLWIFFFSFLIPSFSLIVLSLMASFVIGEIFHGLLNFFLLLIMISGSVVVFWLCFHVHFHWRFSVFSLGFFFPGASCHYLWYIHMACAVLCVVTQSCPTLGDPTDCGCQAPLSMGLLQARILEWLPCPPPGGLPDPGEIEPGFPALQVDSLPSEPPGKPTHGVVINKLPFR